MDSVFDLEIYYNFMVIVNGKVPRRENISLTVEVPRRENISFTGEVF
jgi:hypothetical protein